MVTRPNPRTTLANNVAKLMTMRGWNQATLAAKAGVGQKTISNIVNSRKDVQLETLDSIARAFGLNIWHLIMPSLPDELLSSKALETLFSGYLTASQEGRELINAVVKRETARTVSDG